jgi:hypothetical protein
MCDGLDQTLTGLPGALLASYGVSTIEGRGEDLGVTDIFDLD